MAGHLERPDLSVGTFRTVAFFSRFKIVFIFGCAGSCCTGSSLAAACRFLVAVASPVAERGL